MLHSFLVSHHFSECKWFERDTRRYGKAYLGRVNVEASSIR